MIKLKRMTAILLSAVMLVCMLCIPAGATSKVAAPNDVSVYFNDTRGICLQWAKVSGADRYRILMYDKSSKKYTTAAETPGALYIKEDVEPGKTYKFKVASLTKNGTDANGQFTYKVQGTSSVIKVKTQKITPAAPKMKVKVNGERVTVTFDAVKGATNYRLYMYDFDKKKFVLKSEMKSKVFSFDTEPGTKYSIKVSAVFEYGSVYKKEMSSKKFTFTTAGKSTSSSGGSDKTSSTTKKEDTKTSSANAGEFKPSSAGDSSAQVLKRNGITEYTTSKKKSVVKYTAEVRWNGKVCKYEASFTNDKLGLEAVYCEGTEKEYEKLLAAYKKKYGEPQQFGNICIWEADEDTEISLTYTAGEKLITLAYMYPFAS